MQPRASGIFIYANITRMIFYSLMHAFCVLHNNILWRDTKIYIYINYKSGFSPSPVSERHEYIKPQRCGKVTTMSSYLTGLLIASLACKSGASPETLETEHCALRCNLVANMVTTVAISRNTSIRNK